jgi:hypothetical protein
MFCQIGKLQKPIVYFSGKKPSIHRQEDEKFKEQEHPTFFYFYNIGNEKSYFNNNKNAYNQGYQNSVHFPNVNQIIIQKNRCHQHSDSYRKTISRFHIGGIFEIQNHQNTAYPKNRIY